MKYIPLVLLFFLIACKCKDGMTFLLDEEFKSYTDFPEGSWWVYEKAGDPSLTDSIYLYRITEKLFTRRGSCDEYQQIFYHAFRFRDKDTTEIFWNSRYFTDSTKIERPVFWFGVQYVFAIPIPTQPTNIMEIEVINGIEYYKTITYSHKASNFILLETYAKDVGVTRRMYQDSSLFEIKKYFINR